MPPPDPTTPPPPLLTLVEALAIQRRAFSEHFKRLGSPQPDDWSERCATAACMAVAKAQHARTSVACLAVVLAELDAEAANWTSAYDTAGYAALKALRARLIKRLVVKQ